MSEQLYDQWQEALQRARAAEQQLQKTQAALESSLALQDEDQQTIATMRALLERTVVALHGGYQAPEDELDIREAIETFLAEHPQPVEDALVDEKDE